MLPLPSFGQTRSAKGQSRSNRRTTTEEPYVGCGKLEISQQIACTDPHPLSRTSSSAPRPLLRSKPLGETRSTWTARDCKRPFLKAHTDREIRTFALMSAMVAEAL